MLFMLKFLVTLLSPVRVGVFYCELAKKSTLSPSTPSQHLSVTPPPPPPPSSVPPPLPTSQPPVSSENTESGVKWKDHPLYAEYFRMLRYGVPPDTIKSKLSFSGLDPTVIELCIA